MSVQFDCWDIDNNAINIVTNQLLPYLKYDPDSEYRILDLDKEGLEDKHMILYDEIFLPYLIESRKHFHRHHRDGCFYTDSWYGEQTCLSMIHYLNQKAWYLLHYYAVEEAVQAHCRVDHNKLKTIVSQTTSCLLDHEMSVADAVKYQISKEIKLKKHKEEILVNDIIQTIAKYADVPSHPMVYR